MAEEAWAGGQKTDHSGCSGSNIGPPPLQVHPHSWQTCPGQSVWWGEFTYRCATIWTTSLSLTHPVMIIWWKTYPAVTICWNTTDASRRGHLMMLMTDTLCYDHLFRWGGCLTHPVVISCWGEVCAYLLWSVAEVRWMLSSHHLMLRGPVHYLVGEEDSKKV